MTLGIRQYPHAVDLALTTVQKGVSKLPRGEDHRPDIHTSRPADAYAPSPRIPHLCSLPFHIWASSYSVFLSVRVATVPLCWRGYRTTSTTPGERPDLRSGGRSKRQHHSEAISDDPRCRVDHALSSTGIVDL